MPLGEVIAYEPRKISFYVGTTPSAEVKAIYDMIIDIYIIWDEFEGLSDINELGELDRIKIILSGAGVRKEAVLGDEDIDGDLGVKFWDVPKGNYSITIYQR